VLGENVGILKRHVLCVIEFFESDDALLDGLLGEEVGISGKPVHNIHFVSQVDTITGAENLDSICSMLVDETLDHVVKGVSFLHQGLYFLTSI
jgi:hypothetical protein